jgi:hypothetical protein
MAHLPPSVRQEKIYRLMTSKFVVKNPGDFSKDFSARLGIESRRGRDFPRMSRPALGHTQPPVKWVPALSRE